MNNIKPCPFCGKTPTIHTKTWKNGVTSYRLGCVNDYCQVRPESDEYSTMDTAIEVWNHRPNDHRKAELLSDVRNLEIKLEELDKHLAEKDAIIRKQALLLAEVGCTCSKTEQVVK